MITIRSSFAPIGLWPLLMDPLLMLRFLSTGYGDSGSVIGMSNNADRARFSEKCRLHPELGHSASYFRCLSLERIFGYWAEIQTRLQYDAEDTDASDADLQALAILLTSRIPFGFREVLSSFHQDYIGKIENFGIVLTIVLVACLLCIVLLYILEVIVLASLDDAVITFRSLLLRVDPVAFVSTPQMIQLIVGGQDKDDRVVSPSHAVYQTSKDALISLNHDGIIESLNPSANVIFGYTSERMLGHPLKLLMNPEVAQNAALFSTMTLMTKGQSGLVYEANIEGKKDDGTVVPLRLTLLGFSSNGRLAESFAVMCKDQTDDMIQKSAVEKANKHTENLLMQILPRHHRVTQSR
jgi:PAS domain S-box-containing protein